MSLRIYEYEYTNLQINHPPSAQVRAFVSRVLTTKSVGQGGGEGLAHGWLRGWGGWHAHARNESSHIKDDARRGNLIPAGEAVSCSGGWEGPLRGDEIHDPVCDGLPVALPM